MANPARTLIINFWEFYVKLEHLATLVKPRGTLYNTVAEIAFQVIGNGKTGKAIKRVLPLRVTTFLQSASLMLGTPSQH